MSENVAQADVFSANRAEVGLIDRLARSVVRAALSRITRGRLMVHESGESTCYGSHVSAGGIDVSLQVRNKRLWRAVAFGGSLGAGEAYMQGWWSASDLAALVRLLIANEEGMNALDRGWGRLLAPTHSLIHSMRRNTRSGSRRNIAAHYDIGNEFYRLWLDDTMCYSCGIFEQPDSTMREASIAKMDRICRKLRLSPSDHLVEIGTGWGGFAIHAAANYGCRVTTTTISERQFELARERVRAAGLDNRITVLEEDYRDIRGRFDKLASIEMIEAIGWRQFESYFSKCADLLKPDGMACIQAITIADRYYDAAKRDVDFVKRFIFPGCCIPSIGAMAQSIGRASDLTIAHLESLGIHYARTLRTWRETLFARLDEVQKLGMSTEFIRMWEFYLAYCEGAFAERRLDVVQMVLHKPRCNIQSILAQVETSAIG